MSEKPASASPPPEARTPELVPRPSSLAPRPSRRSFLRWSVVAWLIFCAWLLAAGYALVRFMFPRVLYEPDPRFVAGKRSDYPEVNKVYENFKQTQAVWLVRLIEDGQDRLVAISAVCTHLGCPANWLEAEQRFKCPCHGSGFYRNGVNFEGPAPRPLDRHCIFLDAAGNIVVDKSRTFRKDLGQCNARESYLAMS